MTLDAPPLFWWRTPAPPPSMKACYSTKTMALTAFVQANTDTIQNYGGIDYKVSPAEFDAINHKYGLKGKQAARSISDALWAALPPQKRPPYCLEDIDIDALNDTSPARETTEGFRLPDWAEENRLIREQEASWYRGEGMAGRKPPMNIEREARDLPRKEFIAQWLIQMTKRKANRDLVKGYQVFAKRDGSYVVKFGGQPLVTAKDADSLYDWARRSPLNYYVREAEDLRATAYERASLKGAARPKGFGMKPGDRVQLHPATDRWMMGDRYGTVTKVTKKKVYVKLDKSRKTMAFHPRNVTDPFGGATRTGTMSPATEKAYRAWRKAAESGYGERTTTPAQMARVDERIRRLKARYEKLLVADKGKSNPLGATTKKGWSKSAPKTKGARRALLQRCGRKAFLVPSKLKFPVVSARSQTCEPDCRGLLAAKQRATMQGKQKLAAKANRLAKRAGCHWAR